MSDRGRELEAAVARVRERIARAATRSGRAPEDVRLIAVSKTFPAEDAAAAIRAGATELGENRVQEGVDKRAHVDLPARWHLIGHLQRNKARRTAESFDVVQTVDDLDLGRKLSDRVAELGREPLSILIQVHLGDEASKSGVAPDAVAELARGLVELAGVRLDGLMAIPPFDDDPDSLRPWVRELRRLRDETRRRLPAAAAERLRELSIGMSHDFEVAIEEGATMVRVGSAILGPRTLARTPGSE